MQHEVGEFVGFRGQRLYCQTWLPDEAAVAVAVLTHGLAEHSGRYQNLAARLTARGVALHAYDLRGHGRSPGVRSYAASFEALVGDLALVLERARHRGLPVTLIGHSFGGAVALHAALDCPSLIDALVLSAPAIASDPAVPQLKILLGRVLSKVSPQTGILRLPAAAVSRDPAVVRAYEADPLVYRGAVPARTMVELLGAMRRIQARAGELRVPTLILHGCEDRLVPLRFNRPVYERLGAPDLTIRLYEKLFHEVFNEPEQAQVYADLEAWMDAHR